MAPKREKAETTDTSAPATPSAPRMSLQMTDDGTRVALDRMRPATREQLRGAFTDPTFLKEFGLQPAGSDTPSDTAGAIDNSTLAVIIYSAASSLMVGLARRSGYTAEQAGVLAFTPQETNELAPLTGKVLAKYLPTGKYQDEIMLALALTATVAGKVALLRKAGVVLPFPPPQQPQQPASVTDLAIDHSPNPPAV